MSLNNTLVKKADENKFSVKIQSDAYKNLINNTLGDPKRAQRFIASVSSAVSTNKDLQKCDAGSVLSAALLGEALNLSPSPQLGQYYMVPYNDNKNGCKVAQFQLGYKGYIQLAVRSGYYTKLNVLAIKENELIRFDPLDEIIEVKLIDDEIERENAETIGYYAMFEYQNGFRKAMYWSKQKMEAHARQYSFAYRAGKRDSFWFKDFDGMAIKTMLRQLISHWGIMSTELQSAYVNDMAVVHEDGRRDYVDNVDAAKPELRPQPVSADTMPDAPQPEEPERPAAYAQSEEVPLEDKFFADIEE